MMILTLFFSIAMAAPDFSQKIPATSGIQQVIWVTSAPGPSSQAELWALQKKSWQKIGSAFAVSVGKKGTTPANDKKEGDLKTPEGLYSLSQIFSKTFQSEFKMTPVLIQHNDKWIDDPAHKDYNLWVRGDTTARSFENLWRDDGVYDFFAVVDYNTHPIVKGKGSAIFMHIWGGEGQGTAGCVAMPRPKLKEVLSWLDPKLKPSIWIGN